MKKTSIGYLNNILLLHKALLLRFLLIDISLGVCSSLFICIPLHVLAVSLENLSFLVVTVFFVLFFQIHFYRSYCGHVTYYLMLPIKRFVLIGILIINSISPLIITMVLTSAVKLVLGSVSNTTNDTGSLDRLFYVSIVLIFIKVLPIPIFILAKKHLVLVPLFLIFMCFVYLALSLINELLSSLIHLPSFVIAIELLLSVIFICWKIITSAKLE